MTRVPNLHIRNVPEEVYEALRARAKREGRSINAEALRILEEVAQRERGRRETPITDRLAQLAREINWPPDAPKPEDLIRRVRDASL